MPGIVQPPASGVVSRRARRAFRTALLGAALVVLANTVLQWRAVSKTCAAAQCRQPQLSPRGAADLASSGMSLYTWATATTVISLLLSACLMAMAALVINHSHGRPRLTVPMVLLVCAAGSGSAFLPWGWLGALLGVATLIGIFWLLATYPTGRFEPAWAAVPFVVAVGWAVISVAPGVGRAVSAGRQPWVIVYGVGFALCVCAVLVAQVVRYRRGDWETRRALGAVSTALAVLVVFGASWSTWSGTHPVTHGIGTLPSAIAAQAADVLLVLAMAAAVTGVVSRDTYVLRVVVDRGLAAVVVLTVGGLVYAASAVAMAAISDGWPAHAMAGVATAVVAGSLLRGIVTGVDRLIFGEIGDPRSLAADIAAMVTRTRDTSLLVVEVLELTARRLFLPAVELVMGPGGTTDISPPGERRPGGVGLVELTPSSAGPPGDRPRPVALRVHLQPGRRRLSRRERSAVLAIGPAVLSCVTAVALNEELQRSRLRLAAAVAEERRSIRRDLHDELGQLLASARNRVAAARAELPDGPGRANLHLERADLALSDSIEWVRMLARALRPPLLDEAGLAAAVRAAGADLGLTVSVTDAVTDLSIVPGDVETAVYRIVIEALVNISRHAATAQAGVHFGIDGGELVVVVRDDGIGMREPSRAGVGLSSMRERVDELGGSVSVTSSPGLGTRVEIRLPVADSPKGARRASADISVGTLVDTVDSS
jgi:signal transduction histidine kinase